MASACPPFAPAQQQHAATAPQLPSTLFTTRVASSSSSSSSIPTTINGDDENAPPNDIVRRTRELLLKRLHQLKRVCNDGFGVVPITNSFTVKSPSLRRNGARIALPETSELRVLIQIGFPTGRQALFQTVATDNTGTPLAELEKEACDVVMFMDDGIDVGIIRGIEHVETTVPFLPEIPFTRVLRKASVADRQNLQAKKRDEVAMLREARAELTRLPGVRVHLQVVSVEFQADRRKLIVFVENVKRVGFGDFVAAVHRRCVELLGLRRVRVFVQRKFVEQLSSLSP